MGPGLGSPASPAELLWLGASTSGLNYMESQHPQAFIPAMLTHAFVVVGSLCAACVCCLPARVLSLCVTFVHVCHLPVSVTSFFHSFIEIKLIRHAVHPFKNQWVVIMCTELGNYYHTQFENISTFSERSPVPFCYHPQQRLQPSASLVCMTSAWMKHTGLLTCAVRVSCFAWP